MAVKALSGFRLVNTRYGDTLQKVAARELADASKWAELIQINGLEPPYLTDDPGAASDTVKLTGDKLIVPSATQAASVDIQSLPTLGRDISLVDGLIQDEDGDLALVEGTKNYVQALEHLVVTDKGELIFHQTYGAGLYQFIGTTNNRTNLLMARSIVKKALLADKRTKSVPRISAVAQGDSLSVSADAVAIDDNQVIVDQVI